MNIRQIETFCAVMQSGSVAGAARLLAISPAAISRMVRHTEDQIGYALFDRRGGRLVPTADAQVLFAAAQEALGGMRRVSALASAIGSGAPGLLRVAANPSFGASLLPQAAVEFRRRNRQGRLDINTTAQPAVVERLLLRQADLGLTQFRTRNPLLWEERLASFAMCVALPPDAVLARQPTVRLEDLAALPLIGYDSDTPIGAVVNSHLAACGTERLADIVVRYPMIACMFVQAGLGVAIVDPFVVPGFAHGRICFRPIAPAPSTEVWLLRHVSAPLSQAGRLFAQAVQAVLRRWPRPN